MEFSALSADTLWLLLALAIDAMLRLAEMHGQGCTTWHSQSYRSTLLTHFRSLEARPTIMFLTFWSEDYAF